MSRIVRVDLVMVDLKPKVKRVDAIQSFVSQETPIVRITDADGAVGTGYSYTIGTGGHSVMALLERTLAPAIIGEDANDIEKIWRKLLFLTHATTVGAITAMAMAAIDTALWDLKARRANLPVHKLAGGAQDKIRLYTTEGGWLHLEQSALVEDALRAKEAGFGGCKLKVGRPIHEDVARISAVREAVGPGFEIFTDANQAFAVDEAIRRARAYEGLDLGWLEEPLPADDIAGHRRLVEHTSDPDRGGRASTVTCISGSTWSSTRRAWCRSMSAASADHAVAEGGASRRVLQHAGVPAFPDGAACGAVRGSAECALGRIHPAARAN